jgi:hypothetical protein
MKTFVDSSITKVVSTLLVVCLVALHVPAAALVDDSPSDDLKTIQYKYYYRGQYKEAVDALKTFLARTDLTRDVEVSAREFLAASYILSGQSDKGKEQFLRLLNEDDQYTGPDTTVFKAEVVDAFETTRDALASVKLRTAPDTGEEGVATAAAEPSKPIYKKWWFYVGLAAVVLVVAAAASPQEEDEPQGPPAPTGTVTVGVRVR